MKDAYVSGMTSLWLILCAVIAMSGAGIVLQIGSLVSAVLLAAKACGGLQ